MSTHNIHFRGEIRKILTCYPLLSGHMGYLSTVALAERVFKSVIQAIEPATFSPVIKRSDSAMIQFHFASAN